MKADEPGYTHTDEPGYTRLNVLHTSSARTAESVD